MAGINTIYHYCSVDTFNLIISNKCIRASDLNKTNDYMEKRWACKMLLSIIQDELEKLGVKINLDENYKYWDGIDSHRKFLEKEIISFMDSADPILIACFSKQKDTLSQWRAYGQDGYGSAIGFDLNKIRLLQDMKSNINVKDVI